MSLALPSPLHHEIMLAGGVMQLWGFSVSLTVTVNVQVEVLGTVAVSVAVQVTVVTPLLKVEPVGGTQLAANEVGGQLSVAVGVV